MMKTDQIFFEDGIIEDAFGQIESLQVWPAGFDAAEIKVARADLRLRLQRFIQRLESGGAAACESLVVLQQRPQVVALPVDKASPIQALAIVLRLQEALLVIKIWVRSSFPRDKGERSENVHDPGAGKPRRKKSL